MPDGTAFTSFEWTSDDVLSRCSISFRTVSPPERASVHKTNVVRPLMMIDFHSFQTSNADESEKHNKFMRKIVLSSATTRCLPRSGEMRFFHHKMFMQISDEGDPANGSFI